MFEVSSGMYLYRSAGKEIYIYLSRRLQARIGQEAERAMAVEHAVLEALHRGGEPAGPPGGARGQLTLREMPERPSSQSTAGSRALCGGTDASKSEGGKMETGGLIKRVRAQASAVPEGEGWASARVPGRFHRNLFRQSRHPRAWITHGGGGPDLLEGQRF